MKKMKGLKNVDKLSLNEASIAKLLVEKGKSQGTVTKNQCHKKINQIAGKM